jgi:hypothetical protein
MRRASLHIYFQCRLTCCFSLCLLYFNIEKKSYGNIDEVEKHSHQVATKFPGTPIKSGELKLVLWVQSSPRSKIMLSYKCFPHVSKMPILTYNRTNSVIIKKAIILNIISTMFLLEFGNVPTVWYFLG